jgi:hypothetical protein
MKRSCQLAQALIASPIGPYNVAGCDAGLHSVQLSPEVTDDNFLRKGSDAVQLLAPADVRFVDLERWMQVYFSQDAAKKFPEVDVCPEVVDQTSDAFSHKVLTTLMHQVIVGNGLRAVF